MKHFISNFALLFIAIISNAQTDTIYTEKYLTKSTTFAATTIGADFLMVGGGTSTFTKNGISKSVDFSPTAIPRLSIGGTHFWGIQNFTLIFLYRFWQLKISQRTSII